MLELAEHLLPLLDAGQRIALATTIEVSGSAPHPRGTTLALMESGQVLGGLADGCVDEEARDGCAQLLAGAPPSVRRLAFGDEEAAAAGLACGGALTVLFHLADADVLREALRDVHDRSPAVAALIVHGPARLLGRAVGRSTSDPLLAEARTVVRLRGQEGVDRGEQLVRSADGLALFVDAAAARPAMAIIGATPTGSALAAAAAAVGYHVVVIEMRSAFATRDRVPRAHEVIRGRADEVLGRLPLGPQDAVCVLTHDEDLDPLALITALERDVGYVGALGSRATHWRRVERLRLLGLDEAHVRRLRSPIGLDLGARTPSEVAVSILAEVLAVRSGRKGGALRSGVGPLHARIDDGRRACTDAVTRSDALTSPPAALDRAVPSASRRVPESVAAIPAGR